MQISEYRCNVLTSAGINNKSGSCIENSLQTSQHSSRYATKNGVAVIDAAGDETVDECLPGLNREGMTDGAQLPQLEEAAADDATDVIGHRQIAVDDEAKIAN